MEAQVRSVDKLTATRRGRDNFACCKSDHPSEPLTSWEARADLNQPCLPPAKAGAVHDLIFLFGKPAPLAILDDEDVPTTPRAFAHCAASISVRCLCMQRRCCQPSPSDEGARYSWQSRRTAATTQVATESFASRKFTSPGHREQRLARTPPSQLPPS